MKKIRWAVIGAGGIADRRGIPGLLSDKQNELVAIMDTNAELVKALSEKYTVDKYFTNAEEMLSTVKCDAVYIATPVFCHYEQAMLALKYGVNVLIEKPLAKNHEECQKLLEAFKTANKQLTVGYVMSHHNLHKKAREIVDNDGIGELACARFQFSCWYPDIPGAWRQTKALGGGGCIMDLAVHCMELFTNVTGEEIAEIKAFYNTKTFSYEVEDSAVIAFKSNKGTLGNIDVNFNVPDNATIGKFELYGTKGSLYAEGTLGQAEVGKLKHIYAPQAGYDAMQNKDMRKSSCYYGKGKNIYGKQFAAFNKILLSGKTDYTNATLATDIQKLCDDIYKN